MHATPRVVRCVQSPSRERPRRQYLNSPARLPIMKPSPSTRWSRGILTTAPEIPRCAPPRPARHANRAFRIGATAIERVGSQPVASCTGNRRPRPMASGAARGGPCRRTRFPTEWSLSGTGDAGASQEPPTGSKQVERPEFRARDATVETHGHRPGKRSPVEPRAGHGLSMPRCAQFHPRCTKSARRKECS